MFFSSYFHIISLMNNNFTLMLKSFEYIDPTLAQKIYNLQRQIKKAEQAKQQVMKNTKIGQKTKKKLISYQQECIQTLRKLLQKEKQKMVEYLDTQTNIISKENKIPLSKQAKSLNNTMNQSTRIDFSADQTKSIDISKTDIPRKISSFYMTGKTVPINTTAQKGGNMNTRRIKRLKKKVGDQQKLIKMLTTWVKIYYQREQSMSVQQNECILFENQLLKEKNAQLESKYKKIEDQLRILRSSFESKAQRILSTHQRYEMIKNENMGLNLERRQLLKNATSLKKPRKQ